MNLRIARKIIKRVQKAAGFKGGYYTGCPRYAKHQIEKAGTRVQRSLDKKCLMRTCCPAFLAVRGSCKTCMYPTMGNENGGEK